MKAKADKPREVAFHILYEVDVRGAYVDLSLKRHLQKHKLSGRDRALVSEICYGVVRYLLTLDWLIERVTGRKASKIDPKTRNILRLSFYQITYLEKIPASAACNEGVELAKKYSHKGAAKFVNGVIRGFIRQKDGIKYPDYDKDLLNYITIRYSFPSWMVKRWIEGLGPGNVEEMLASLNMPSTLTVRTNTLKINRRELIKVLGEESMEAEEGFCNPESIVIKKARPLSGSKSFREGFFQVQGESSMLVSRLLDPQPGEIILDSCSAPGGKSTHIAQLMGDKGRVICFDIYPHKIKIIEKNAKRMGINTIEPVLGDARNLPSSLKGNVDRALVDAPCSGLGVLRGKPDLKWKRRLADIRELPGTQIKVLEEAARALKPSGILVYSVCTNEPEETTEVFKCFMKRNPDFVPCDLNPCLPYQFREESTLSKGFLHILPYKYNLDGFFLARWQKKG